MSINIKTIGHGISVGFHDLYVGTVATEKFVQKIAGNADLEQKAEAIAGLIDGVQGQNIVRMSFAVLGELASVLLKGEAALEQHLLDAGLDKSVLDAAKQLIADAKPQLIAAGVKLS
jgi:hypothetical protein